MNASTGFELSQSPIYINGVKNVSPIFSHKYRLSLDYRAKDFFSILLEGGLWAYRSRQEVAVYKNSNAYSKIILGVNPMRRMQVYSSMSVHYASYRILKSEKLQSEEVWEGKGVKINEQLRYSTC